MAQISDGELSPGDDFEFDGDTSDIEPPKVSKLNLNGEGDAGSNKPTARLSNRGKHGGPRCEGNLKLLNTLDAGSTIMCCRFSPNGRVLAAGLYDGNVKIFNADTGQHLYTLADTDTKTKKPVTMVRFRTPNLAHRAAEKQDYEHVIIVSYVSGLVKFWHYTSGRCLLTLRETVELDGGGKDSRQTLGVATNPEGSKFLTAGSDPVIRVYDENTKQLINCCEASENRDVMNGHRSRVFALTYHPASPHLFLTGGWDDTVQFWDDRQPHAVRKIAGPHLCGDALDIDATHDHIVTGSWRKNNTLQIWDFPTGNLIKDVPTDHHSASQLYCVQWLGKDSIIVGGGDFNLARVIDRGTLNNTGMLVDLPQAVYCVDNDRQTNPRISICSDDKVYMAKIEKRV